MSMGIFRSQPMPRALLPKGSNNCSFLGHLFVLGTLVFRVGQASQNPGHPRHRRGVGRSRRWGWKVAVAKRQFDDCDVHVRRRTAADALASLDRNQGVDTKREKAIYIVGSFRSWKASARERGRS